MPTVAAIIASMLENIGIDRVFSVSGESYLGLLDELNRRKNIDVVTCRHEGGAGLMAVADAKLSGRPGICLVSRGPGAANASLGLHAAHQDTVPFILLVGQVERAHLRRDAFQEVDYSKFFSGTAKWSAEINDPDRAADIMSRALHVATSGTPGPVVIALPEDVLAQQTETPAAEAYRAVDSAPSAAAVQEVTKLLQSAQRPLLIAGGGLANDAGRAALLRAAQAWNIPVMCSFRRHDLFPNAHELFAGELGFFNRPKQLARLEESDLIIAVATRLGDLTTQGYTFPRSPQPRQPLIHVHADPEVLGLNFVPTMRLACSGQVFLDALANAPPGRTSRDPSWAKDLRTYRNDIAHWQATEATDGVVFGNVVTELKEHIAPDAIVSMDAGVSAGMLYRHYDWTPPQILLTPITGAMGWGMPGAVAAALRHPKRQVICMIGDGGFLMGGMELAVAMERQLPITIVLANNNSYGAIRRNLEQQYPGCRTGTDLCNPDFNLLGRAFGCRTFKISAESDIRPVLAEAFGQRTLTLVEVNTSLDAALPHQSSSLAKQHSQHTSTPKSGLNKLEKCDV